MALHIAGTATKNGVEVRFDWGFADNLDFGSCKCKLDGIVEEVLPLEGGKTIDVNLVIDPRNLFSVDGASLVQAIVDSDQVSGNGNGRVAIDELVAMSVNNQSENLGEVLRTKTYPSMFLYDGIGTCTLGSECGHHPGGGF
jgi:hypothetical protein